MKLNFFCFGAAKSGTSTIHDILCGHPDILLPEVKETKFFSLNYNKGYNWYWKNYFKGYQGEKAIGEIYPCMSSVEAPKRLYETLGGNIKIFAILRNPADRAYSNYLAQKRILNHNFSFQEALEELPFLIDKGLYSKNIQRFAKYFPMENMKFFIFETDFINDRKNMIDDLLKFLEVRLIPLDIEKKSNNAWKPKSKILNQLIFNRPYFLTVIIKNFISTSFRQKIRLKLTKLNSQQIESPKLSDGERAEVLRKYFKSDIENLEKLLGVDLSVWYDQQS